MTDANKGGMTSNTKWGLLAAAVGVLVGGGAMALYSGVQGGGASKSEIEQTVRAYLLEHPEVLQEASQRLQQREMGKAVEANRAAFETPFAGAWAGAADADVTLVEFFDYACGYCKKSNADVDRLLREDPKLKVVWREWPVLGQDSEQAAIASLAAAQAGKYRTFYDTLFAAGRPDAAAVARAQQAAGISPQAVAQMAASPAARDEMSKNMQLAQTIGASGTPTFVVGDEVLQGAVGYGALKEAIDKARSGA
ncbi:MAG TPA: DsbA family protein [Allosphingosinicella sp.]|jgi:protein-disulfide isomerase